ncbi:hypothetical protein PVIIG_06287 [Plasmodium vivax India VII]|uniref:Variable surface protein Vir10 n=1 Tax=Plasmodium vivax India VII TaxID=1077284 RepID=A0A0J9S4Z7_PLAVI|nr:hypothetical protein PVIIG_06287 [Plasmodium vivax India VII]
MKNYKKRYMRKKGLSKLDCYYENKIFRKFNNICDIGKKMQYDENLSKKVFLKKYGLGLIIFALIPVLGFIFPILFGFSRKFPGILGPCPLDHFKNSGTGEHKTDNGLQNCTTKWIEKKSDLIGNFECANMIFTIIMVTIVILFFIYIFIKVIKYEKIKAGKGK